MVASIARAARAIPLATTTNQVQVLNAIKAVLDAFSGQTDPYARVLQVGDFRNGELDLGTITGGGGTGGGGTVVVGGGDGGYDPATDLTTPPQPTGLQAIGGYETVLLSWDIPDPLVYKNPSLVEIWASPTDIIGNAQLVGRSSLNQFVDRAGHDQAKYYWIRFVSAANVTGPWNATPGTFAQTALDVSSVLDALTHAITFDQLATDLGARINLIDGNGAGSVNERITVSSGNLQSQIDTVSTTVSGHTTTLQTQATSIDGIEAKYTVKIDNNGYVSGYGLISEPNNGNIVSSFAVRADRFSISSPTGPGITPITPFVVQTTATTINGIAVPPGVYMDAAFIKVGTIARAQIGLAAIDDARIENLSALKLTVGDGTVGGILKSANFSAGVAGWKLGTDGTLNANSVSLRGQITGGPFTTYDWPASGKGFYLGAAGLLLGNYNDYLNANGGYFQIDAASGNVFAPQFSIINGAASFGGSLSAASGTFGTVTAGLLRNSGNTAAVNLSAGGSQNFIRAGSYLNYGFFGNHYQVEINADGSGFMERGLVSPPKPLVYNGNWSIPVPVKPATAQIYWTPNNTYYATYMGEFAIDTGMDDPAGWAVGGQAAEMYMARAYALASSAHSGNAASLPANTELWRIIIQATPSWSANQYLSGSTSFPDGPNGPSGRVYLTCRVWCIDAYYGPDYVNQPFSYGITLDSVQWEMYRA